MIENAIVPDPTAGTLANARDIGYRDRAPTLRVLSGINQSRCLANGELPENPTRDVRKTDR